MTDDEAKRLLKRAKYLAKRYYRREAEDMSQETMLELLERGRGPTVYQAMVSAGRKFHGDARCSESFKLLRQHISLTRNGQERSVSYIPKSIDLDAKVEIQKHLNTLNREQRIIFLLEHLWGLKRDEIAFVFGFSPGRITQLIGESCDNDAS